MTSEESTNQTEDMDQRDAGQSDAESEQGQAQGANRDETLARISQERKEARERARQAEARLAELEAKQREADEAKAKEEGKYRELLEAREKELEDMKRQVAERDMREIRARVAEKHGIPAELAARLTGETEADIEEDAKAIAGVIAKREAPDNDTGKRSANDSGQRKNDSVLANYKFG